MLFAVGWLAGDRPRTQFAYSAFAFGLWDIFYYLFLIPLTGWPRSLLDWDILFLLPVPWWGPVIAPIAISILMIAGGLLVIWIGDRAHPACLNAGLPLERCVRRRDDVLCLHGRWPGRFRPRPGSRPAIVAGNISLEHLSAWMAVDGFAGCGHGRAGG